MDPISSKTALAAAGAAGGEGLYVDDVFSTYLYDGTSSNQSINNGIDLSGEGGLVWLKRRNSTASHTFTDTERGANKILYSNSTTSELSGTWAVNGFNSNGFSLTGQDTFNNASNNQYASWTFRKAPGFFDVVTYTGTGSAQNISHSLGSVPGMILIKCTSDASDWSVYHRSLGATKNMHLNNTSVADTQTGVFNDTEPTATHFTVNYDGDVNGNGRTYVAYVFAHDDQSFGTDGNESIIKCGITPSISAYGTATIDLGWEPQFLLVKPVDRAGNWIIADNMRGLYPSVSSPTGAPALFPNSTNVESSASDTLAINSTGFTQKEYTGGSTTYIYTAIRRPHKPPEAGTDVFSPIATTAGTGTNLTTGFPVDLQLVKDNRTGTNGIYSVSRLTGVNTTDTESNKPYLQTSTINAEGSSNLSRHWDNTGYDIATPFGGNSSIYWNFRRAPGFMDVVTWSGDGSSNRAITHKLGVTPELLITKRRAGNDGWWSQYTGIFGTNTGIRLDQSSGLSTGVSAFTGTSAATSSVFYVGSDSSINGSSDNYVAYLFATLDGISKVGTYTGTGSDINVDCGFTAGARFVLIKRTDSTGDWYVLDSTRGIVTGNDPYLLINSTAAEVTNTDYIDPLNAGFTVTSSAPAALNASGGTYLFLAIA